MFILYNERKRRNNNDTFIQILIRVLDYTHTYINIKLNHYVYITPASSYHRRIVSSS